MFVFTMSGEAMPRFDISILFPQSWPAWRINDALVRIRAQLLGLEYSLDYESGDTDSPCVDSFPQGLETDINRAIAS